MSKELSFIKRILSKKAGFCLTGKRDENKSLQFMILILFPLYGPLASVMVSRTWLIKTLSGVRADLTVTSSLFNLALWVTWEDCCCVLSVLLPVISKAKFKNCNPDQKTRQKEEEVGKQHQGMDRPGVCQVPEGSEEQGKMEETGCEIFCGAPMTLAVKG